MCSLRMAESRAQVVVDLRKENYGHITDLVKLEKGTMVVAFSGIPGIMASDIISATGSPEHISPVETLEEFDRLTPLFGQIRIKAQRREHLLFPVPTRNFIRTLDESEAEAYCGELKEKLNKLAHEVTVLPLQVALEKKDAAIAFLVNQKERNEEKCPCARPSASTT
ncbi:unnamed protein product [Bursaphelenchus xylophilus]|uniref:(pine wood nematode) hypothetical protein n=1 Tax=Bursaphelenchus xylophilus TaxID=6326 RepID=A0A1I7S1R0_BURXY|nr:unnamed protein product [Bursaphelenchus xylophilus]CAG9089811.1 unnamed protein product [Bursaphelenchus xylophilus]